MAQRLTIARIASAVRMGAEGYQAQIVERAPQALQEVGARSWGSRELVIRSLRSDLAGNRRLPLSRVAAASPTARRVIGRALYAGDTVTHRMNLELPPAAHGDVVTLHDVVAWRFPDESAPVPAARVELQRAAAVICVSQFTAQEAVELLGIREPHVVHNGVDERFFRAAPLDVSALRRLGIDGPYVLHTGGASSRKNLEGLAAAWPVVHRERPGLALAMAGPLHSRRTDLFGAQPGTVLLGRVDDALMPGLVAAAAAVVVPSLYEGFGLPVLEAMAAGVPVVAADTSSLPEVAGDAAILVPPTGQGLARGLLDVTSGDSAVDELVRAGTDRAARFTWAESARGHARAWASAR
jgi:glycosyltransferase involved in cell wall biosynthesis